MVESRELFYRRIVKNAKIFILCCTLSCKKVSASIRLAVAVAETNLRDLRSQLFVIIQEGEDDGISLIGFLQNIYNGFCIHLNFNGLKVFVHTNG